MTEEEMSNRMDDAVATRNVEDGAQLTCHIPIDPGRIDPADQIGPRFDRFFQQFCRSWTSLDTTLGKRHKLDRHSVLEGFAGRYKGFQN